MGYPTVKRKAVTEWKVSPGLRRVVGVVLCL